MLSLQRADAISRVTLTLQGNYLCTCISTSLLQFSELPDPVRDPRDVLGPESYLLHRKSNAWRLIPFSCSGKLVSSVVAAATNPLDGELHAVDEHKVIATPTANILT